MYIAQPTLSQQIRRLEEMVGAPLLQRRREGVRLTQAGSVLLEESRAVLSRVDHGVSRTRQAAGLGRPRLRFAVPPGLPEDLAADVVSRLRAAATPPVSRWPGPRRRRTGSSPRSCGAASMPAWVADRPADAPAALEVMTLGDFEPDVWLPPRRRPAPGDRPGRAGGPGRHPRSAPGSARSPTTRGWRSCAKRTRALSSPTRSSGGCCRSPWPSRPAPPAHRGADRPTTASGTGPDQQNQTRQPTRQAWSAPGSTDLP